MTTLPSGERPVSEPLQAVSPAAEVAPLVVNDLEVTFRRAGRTVRAVRGVSLDVQRGEILAVVGESGSGKTVLGLTVLGLLPTEPKPAVAGEVLVRGTDMLGAGEAAKRRARKDDLGAVFQDPMSSLNPTMKIGRQIEEASGPVPRTAELLDLVGLSALSDRLNAYPHELSGGQRQRVMLAMAIARNPALVVADEPTTALDVTVQAQILRLIRNLRDELGCSFIFVTHDLAVASEVADRVAVMYAGRLAELGKAPGLLARPRHPYTTLLLRSRISLEASRASPLVTIAGSVPRSDQLPVGCAFALRCPIRQDRCATEQPEATSDGPREAVWCWRSDDAQQLLSQGPPATEDPVGEPKAVRSEPDASIALSVRNVRKVFGARGRHRKREELVALSALSLEVAAGESVALVGESGSGKTTVLRLIAGLERPTSGEVEVAGTGITQLVFQDAAASFTPWLTIGAHLEQRLVAAGVEREEIAGRIEQSLALVGLGMEVIGVKARQMSGGQVQRAALARAVIVPPAVLLADEPTSALDVSLAATVLNLLATLRATLHLSMVFVTHDLAVARFVADRIVVLNKGQVVEAGPAEELIAAPVEAYTRALVSAVPGEMWQRFNAEGSDL